jgi:hypothetical protein
MNVFLADKYTEIDRDQVAEHFGPFDQSKPIDFWVCRGTVPDFAPPERVVLIENEPPLTDHRRMIWANMEKFHTVITYCSNGANVFKFSENPAIFPYNTFTDADIKREDTTIRTRKIYYAGMKSEGYAAVPNTSYFVNLYPLRHILGDALIATGAGYCFGPGWPEISKSYPGKPIAGVADSWRLQKIADMDRLQCDFSLCLENGIMENYLCEKFHDGMMVDRVMLYLGEPNVADYVPKECFVDLRQFWNNGLFDTREMISLAQDMTQSEYDRIIHAAREYRQSIKGKWSARRAEMTQFVIDRIEGKI